MRKENPEQDGTPAPEEEPLDELSLRFLNAVHDRDDFEILQHIIDEGANLNAKNPDGQTALHVAIHNGDTSMVQFLLEKGADPEATAPNGNKPLYDAAESGHFEIVELLLDFNTNVEAFNINEKRTAFYQAVQNGHVVVAKSLLRAGADIDACSPSGLTPLFCAVRRGDVQLVEYLLEHGANKKLQLDDGQTVEDFANGNSAIIGLLQSSQVLQGPSIKNPKSTYFERRIIQMPSLPAEADKQDACHGFEATIIDFFLGDREERIQVSASIYDVLYGKGAEAIMESERVAMMGEQQAQFRWYHLPANNIEWVEALISRIFAEQNTGSATLDDELKSKLGLTSTAGRHCRILTAQSSFMRPLFHTVDTTSKADQLVLFMPYLHFETLRGYEEMAHQISVTRNPFLIEPLPIQHVSRQKRSSRAKRATEPALVQVRKKVPDYSEIDDVVSTTSSETAEKTSSTWKNILHRAGNLRSTLHDLKGKVSSKPARLSRTPGVSAVESGVDNGDLEKGTKKKPTLLHTWLEENAGKSKSITIDRTTAEAIHEAQVTKKKIEFAVVKGIEKVSEGKPANINDSTSKAEKFPDGTQNTTSEQIIPLHIEEQVNSSLASASANQSLPGAPEDTKPLDRPMAPEIPRERQDASQTFPIPSKAGTFKGKEELADIPEGSQPRKEDPGREPGLAREELPHRERRARIAPGQLDELLIKAYSFSNAPGQLPPLQLRRTLDQYFYTHLLSTYERDTDQVVLRYTRDSRTTEPKIFMVDQLWLWVLNGDTVISCFPQRWDTWSTDFRMRPPPPPPADWPGGQPPSRQRPPPPPSADWPGGQPPPRQRPPPPPSANWPGGQPPSRQRPPPPPPANWPGGQPPPRQRPPPPPPANWPGGQPPARQTVPPEPAKLSQLQSDAIHAPSQFPLSEETHDETNILINLNEIKSKDKGKTDPPSFLAWMAGKKKKGRKDSIDAGFPLRETRDSRPTSSIEQEEKKKRRAFLQLDPLNVQQTVLKHLQGTTRAPLTSAYDLANLVTNSCAEVFDQFKTPPEFQFFDFFERSIGALIDQETQCFKLFMSSLDKIAPASQPGLVPLSTDPILSIAVETKLLIEIKDIRDELGILEMILNDQLKVLVEFERTIASKDKNVSVTQSKVLLNHLERIEKMNEQADKTYQALHDLLDLKQKEFNVSEARRQAEITARHVEIAGQSQEQGQRQLTLAEATAQQAEETARQGKTVMLFTVVTIIFLPLSFMSAFFAIAIDSFPVNDNGKLPMSYVLKYMLTISAAISIPFILVAFNQDRIARWLQVIGKGGAIWWTAIAVMIGILLSIIWTSHLVGGIKVAVTVTIVLLALVAGIGQFIYAVVGTTLWAGSSSSGSGSSRSLASD